MGNSKKLDDQEDEGTVVENFTDEAADRPLATGKTTLAPRAEQIPLPAGPESFGVPPREDRPEETVKTEIAPKRSGPVPSEDSPVPTGKTVLGPSAKRPMRLVVHQPERLQRDDGANALLRASWFFFKMALVATFLYGLYYGVVEYGLPPQVEKFIFSDLKEVVEKFRQPKVAGELAKPAEKMAEVHGTVDEDAFIYQPDLYESVGFANVTANPAPSVILINGKKMVDAAGQFIKIPQVLKLPPGRYTLTLKNADGRYKTKQFSIVKGQLVRLEFFLNDR